MTMDYDSVLDALIDGTLSPLDFDHAAHVGAAHVALGRYEFFEAAAVFAAGLRSLSVRAGVPEKYNATITFAFLSLIAERMRDEDAATFVERHGSGGLEALLAAGYRRDRLESDLARRVALLPHPPHGAGEQIRSDACLP